MSGYPKYLLISEKDSVMSISINSDLIPGGDLKSAYFLPCGHRKPGLGAIDIPIDQYKSRFVDKRLRKVLISLKSFRDPLLTAYHWPVLSDDFIELLGIKKTCPGVTYGRLIDPEGVPLHGGRVLFGAEKIIVRSADFTGNDNNKPKIETKANFRVCPKCGYIQYFGYNLKHIYPAPDPDKKILFPDHYGLIIRLDYEEERRKIRKMAKRYYFTDLEVVEEPHDGIEAILTPYRVTPLSEKAVL